VIEVYRPRYLDTKNKQDRMEITKEIFDIFRHSSSRFLKYNGKMHSWEEISATAARDKISHALRRKRISNSVKKLVSRKKSDESATRRGGPKIQQKHKINLSSIESATSTSNNTETKAIETISDNDQNGILWNNTEKNQLVQWVKASDQHNSKQSRSTSDNGHRSNAGMSSSNTIPVKGAVTFSNLQDTSKTMESLFSLLKNSSFSTKNCLTSVGHLHPITNVDFERGSSAIHSSNDDDQSIEPIPINPTYSTNDHNEMIEPIPINSIYDTNDHNNKLVETMPVTLVEDDAIQDIEPLPIDEFEYLSFVPEEQL